LGAQVFSRSHEEDQGEEEGIQEQDSEDSDVKTGSKEMAVKKAARRRIWQSSSFPASYLVIPQRSERFPLKVLSGLSVDHDL
jgi:hypothetical protein